ncbi:MAG TPA: HNH endonuclease [Waddliaceae bacterium]
MHRVIAYKMFGNKLEGMEVDHINRNGLDNRRSNLRLATPSQNRVNSEKKIGVSGFRGVRWDTQRRKWRADIQFKGKKIALGHSNDKELLAKLYDKKEKELYGDFAYINFP